MTQMLDVALRKIGTARKELEASGIQAVVRRLRKGTHSLLLRRRGNGPFEYTTPSGARFVCDPSDSVSRGHFVSPIDELEHACIAKFVRPGDTCLDVGANIGTYTALIASRLKGDGRVIAFEASQETFPVLERHIVPEYRKNVTLLPCAAADVDGQRTFFTRHEGNFALVQSLAKRDAETQAKYRQITVRSRSLDSVAKEHGVLGKIAFIKIDIEGGEPLALRGMAEILAAQAPPLLMLEVNPPYLYQFDFHVEDIFAPIRNTYDVHVLPGLPEVVSLAGTWPSCTNVFAVPRSGAHAARARELLRRARMRALPSAS